MFVKVCFLIVVVTIGTTSTNLVTIVYFGDECLNTDNLKIINP